MDEIQNCIADAQFGEVLRGRDSNKPTMKMPRPPRPFDPIGFAASRGIDFEETLTMPVGVYILSKYNRDAKEIYQFLAELSTFKNSKDPGLKEYTSLLAAANRLPFKYKAKTEEIAMHLDKVVLKQLRAASSLHNLLERNSISSHSSARLDIGRPLSQSSSMSQNKSRHEDWSFAKRISEVPPNPYGEKPEDLDMNDDDYEEKREEALRERLAQKSLTLRDYEPLRTRLLSDQRNVWKAFRESDMFLRLMEVLWYCEQPAALDSFNIFRDLGRGAFGVVSGAKFRVTGSLVALKCMNKKLVKGKNALKLVKMEREVLAKLGEQPSHFTVYLKYSWQDKDNFYLALPLCTGGDLQYHLNSSKYFEPERARFHIAEVVLGLAHLHSLGILYRDLKPDNILLDEEGHCRISDMGLALVTDGKPLRGRAGTPGYWSPEMISKRRYSYATDWWSLGCVLYEMLAGRCPFSSQNTRMERNAATLTWPIQFPKVLGSGVRENEHRRFPSDAKALILRLLDRDKNTRLGAGPTGSNEVKEDPYFSKINWSRLQRREVDALWKPRKETINAFDQTEIDNKSNDHEYRKYKLEPKDMIPDFAYTSMLAHQEDIVEVLKMQDDGRLEHLEKSEPLCCVIS